MAEKTGVRGMLENIQSKLGEVDGNLRNLQMAVAAKQATHTEQLSNMDKRLNGFAEKIKDHLDQHWKWWLGTTGTVGIFIIVGGFLASLIGVKP